MDWRAELADIPEIWTPYRVWTELMQSEFRYAAKELTSLGYNATQGTQPASPKPTTPQIVGLLKVGTIQSDRQADASCLLTVNLSLDQVEARIQGPDAGTERPVDRLDLEAVTADDVDAVLRHFLRAVKVQIAVHPAATAGRA